MSSAFLAILFALSLFLICWIIVLRIRIAPGYHLSWSRVSLALTEGGRRRTSWAIVISGTRSR